MHGWNEQVSGERKGMFVSSSQLPEAKLNGRRILVCTDRSTISEACVPYAVSLAKTFGERGHDV
jgi:hypothetical protein